ncbi:rod shape-determining protein RodA [Clostridium intestinale]|jgi:rod shape determining protein RodA|uniref:Cell cycle protein n=2 Tax=Clostridium intestinale TaxID=36845 RepID=U2Q7E5_9CLOT|nr:rod shape-determining protein RodA [Clostridium intestinale]ERK32064.1 cell cycle protein [Clostridium intestinale URNW]QLY79041.1 rod shape-determining protein RodA [Clostridium intestinale]
MLGKLKLDLKILKELDFTLLLASIMTVLFGCLNIYLATKGSPETLNSFKKQLLFLGLSIVVIYFMLLIDYIMLKNYALIFYILSTLLLAVTPFLGKTINGATGWIRIGGFSMQPSELAKIAIIILVAKKLEDMDGKINDVKNFFILTAYIIVPVLFIVKQPDMGMTMVCFFIVLGMFFIAGLDMRIIGGGLLSLVVAIVIVWNSGLIHTYQKARLTSFLNPEADELNTGLQLTQSMIGIGSGGLFGTGADLNINATTGYVAQNVPEKQTDFIFAVVGEHWGTLGAIFLLTLYGIIIYRMLVISRTSKDILGKMICVGFASYFLFAVLQNIGMTIGLMPITGITLPLVSSGGSSLLTTMMSIGLVLNIGMRKKKINF